MFVLFSVPILLLSILAAPIGSLPDEPAHLQRIYLISTGQIFPSAEKSFLIPAGFLDGLGSSTISSLLKEQFNNISEELVVCDASFATGIYPVTSYMVQALAMKILMALTKNRIIIFYGVRLLTGLFVLAGIYFSMKMVPEKFKMLIILISIIPGTIKSITCASADGMSILSVILLCSFIIHYRENETQFTVWHNLALFVLTFFTISSKFLYSPMVISIFAIPYERWETKKKKNVALVSILLLNLTFIIGWTAYCYSTYVGGRDSNINGILPQLTYILSHPLYYICVLLNTIVPNLWSYILETFCAYSDASYEAYIFVLAIIFTVIAGTSFIDGKKNYVLSRDNRRFFILCAVISIFVVFTALYVDWTPYGEPYINGIQARYFIPLLYPIFAAFISVEKNSAEKNTRFYRCLLFLALIDVKIFITNFTFLLF